MELVIESFDILVFKWSTVVYENGGGDAEMTNDVIEDKFGYLDTYG